MSGLLVKNKITEILIDDIANSVPSISEDDMNILRQSINNQKEIKATQEVVFRCKNIISELLHEQLEEELREITEDLKWKKSKRGKAVIIINEWSQTFYGEFRSFDKYENVFIGGHSEINNVIFITGNVKYNEDIDDLLHYLKSKNPPFKIVTQITVK